MNRNSRGVSALALCASLFLLTLGGANAERPEVSPARRLENDVWFDRRETIQWRSLAFSPDGLLLVGDGEVADTRGLRHVGMTRETREWMQVWDLRTFRLRDREMISSNKARSMVPQFTTDGKLLYGVATENMFHDLMAQEKDKSNSQWKGFSESTELLLWPQGAREAEFLGIGKVPNGSFLAGHLAGNSLTVLSPNGAVQRYKEQITTPPRKGPFGPPPKPTRSVVPDGEAAQVPEAITKPSLFSADGSTLVTTPTSGPAGLIVWDVAGRKLKVRLGIPAPAAKAAAKKAPPAKKNPPAVAKPMRPEITQIAVSRTGGVVAFAVHSARGNGVLVYDTAKEKPIHSLAALAAPVTGLALDAAGTRLLSICKGTPTITDLTTGQEQTLATEGASFTIGTLSADGTRIAAAATDGRLRFWMLYPRTIAEVAKALPDAGTKYQPVPPATLPAALPISPEQHTIYHLMNARRMLGTALDLAQRADAEPSLTKLARDAKAYEKHLRTLTIPQAKALAELYGTLATAIPSIQATGDEIRAIQQLANTKAIEIAQQQASERSNRMLNLYLGLGMAMAGSLTGKEYLGSEGAGNTTIHYYREYELFPGWGEAGVTHMFGTLMESTQRQSRLASLEKLEKSEEGAKLARTLRTRDSAVEKFQTAWQTLAKDSLGIQVLAAPTTLTQGGDVTNYRKWLEADAAVIRARSQRDDPFAKADQEMLKLANGKAPSASALLASAQTIQAQIALVPTGPAYASDRATLVGMVASLRNRAMLQELGKKSLTVANKPEALETVGLLNAVLTQPEVDDPSGWLREQKILALALAGRVTPALEQCRTLANAPPRSSSAMALLARLECAIGDTQRGLDHLEVAIADRGYANLVELRSWPEFPHDHPQFNNLTSISLVASDAGLSNAVRVRNTSPFPLQNLTLKLTMVDTFNAKRVGTKEAFVKELAPGADYPILTELAPATRKVVVDGKSVSVWVGGLIASTPKQGRVETVIRSK